MLRKLLLIASAILMPLGLIAVTGSVAGAVPVASINGTVVCTTISPVRSIAFNPPLTSTGTAASELVTVTATLTGCTTALVPAVVITQGAYTATMKITGLDANNCGFLTAGGHVVAGKFKVVWTTSGANTLSPNKSKGQFNQYVGGTVLVGGNAYNTFTIPGGGGIISLAGAFEGGDLGAASVFNSRSTATAAALTNDCTNPNQLFDFGIRKNNAAPPAAYFG
jgi:hypothetical protein